MRDNIVADSSFYICFLGDIDSPDHLMRILDRFTAHLSKKMFEEVKDCKGMNLILKSKKNKINIFEDTPFELGEATRPFFSKSEIVKGEHEVVVIAYLCYNLKLSFVLIIDEDGPRKFTITRLPYLKDCLRGTVGFIGDCCCDYKIFGKEESLELLEKIGKSKFRVTKDIIAKTKQRING